MAWIEIPALRGKGSRVYRDDANPLKGVVSAQAGLDVTSYWPRRRKYVYQEEWELLQGEFEDEELVMLLLD